MFLEHINLNLPLERSLQAKEFFVSILGCSEDVRPKEMGKEKRLLWADCGLQQFHLPLISNDSTIDKAPQRLRGFPTLVYKSQKALDAVINRIQTTTNIRILNTEKEKCGNNDISSAILIQCPFGGQYKLSVRDEASSSRYVGGNDDSRGHPMNTHPSLSEEDKVVGIQRLDLYAPQKSLDSIGAFWRNSLKCEDVEYVLSSESSSSSSSSFSSPLTSSVVVKLNKTQQIVFIAKEEGIEDYDGHHLCLYLPQYEEAYRACERLGIIYDPGRFADRGGSWELAQEHKQFRVLHWPMISSSGYAHLGILQQLGETSIGNMPAYTLELELRSFDHPAYPCKKL